MHAFVLGEKYLTCKNNHFDQDFEVKPESYAPINDKPTAPLTKIIQHALLQGGPYFLSVDRICTLNSGFS